MISPGQTDLQVDVLKSTLTRTCVRTCDGWPNGFASRLASSRKSQKLVAFTHIQLTCSHVELRWVAKRWNIRRLAYELELDQSQLKSSQVNASGWPNERTKRWSASRLGPQGLWLWSLYQRRGKPSVKCYKLVLPHEKQSCSVSIDPFLTKTSKAIETTFRRYCTKNKQTNKQTN